MHRSTSGVRRACAVGTTIALVGIMTGLGTLSVTSAFADTMPVATQPADAGTSATTGDTTTPPADGGSGTASDAGSAATPTTGATTGDTTGTDGQAAPGEGTSSTPPTAPKPTDPNPLGLKGLPGVGGATTSGETDGTVTTQEAPSGTVSIVGDAAVGLRLTAETTGFPTGSAFTYQWLRNGTPITGAGSSSYRLVSDDATAMIGLVVTVDGVEHAAEPIGPVRPDARPVFTGDPTTKGKPFRFSSTADDTIDQSFPAEGATSYALLTPDGDDVSSDVTDYLPYGLDWDAETGTLTGPPMETGEYAFVVVATNASGIAKSYADLVVTPGKAAGVLVATFDAKDTDSESGTEWIIAPDGSITTIEFSETSFSFRSGGQPTVAQNGTLIVGGGAVDQWGNFVDGDGYGDDLPLPTVTSSVASDVITADAASGGVAVTFPHASTHTLTVSAAGQSNSFAVEVTPAVVVPAATDPSVVVAAAAPTATRGQLAFTGSDDSALITWALGLLAAGVGVTGLRIARRRAGR